MSGRLIWYGEKKSLRALGDDPAPIKRAIDMMTTRLHHCRQFYPWPALADSFQADIDYLQQRLADVQSKSLRE